MAEPVSLLRSTDSFSELPSARLPMIAGTPTCELRPAGDTAATEAREPGPPESRAAIQLVLVGGVVAGRAVAEPDVRSGVGEP